MSCIIEILKTKQDKEYLVVGNGNFHSFCIEGGGEYKGYEYLIIMVGRGHRCGYVAIPEDKPIDYNWYDDNSDPYDVHGGITFCDRDHPAKKLFSIPCTDLWLGFDAAHCNDQVDLVCAEKYFGETEEIKYMKTNDFYSGNPEFGIVRTFDYMESECKSLIDQLVEQSK